MKKLKSGIYCWTSPSNKKYIGQAVDLKNRKSCFLCKTNKEYGGSAINNARKKYDPKLWEYEVLCYCPIEELDDKEIYYIALYDTTDRKKGYNLSSGGGRTMKGLHLSEEQKRKLSEFMKGRFVGEKNPNYGKHHSEETKRLISEANKGRKEDPEHARMRTAKQKKAVLQFTMEGDFVKRWDSARDAERSGLFIGTNVARCCRGKSKSHHGFKWRYAS